MFIVENYFSQEKQKQSSRQKATAHRRPWNLSLYIGIVPSNLFPIDLYLVEIILINFALFSD